MTGLSEALQVHRPALRMPQSSVGGECEQGVEVQLDRWVRAHTWITWETPCLPQAGSEKPTVLKEVGGAQAGST